MYDVWNEHLNRKREIIERLVPPKVIVSPELKRMWSKAIKAWRVYTPPSNRNS